MDIKIIGVIEEGVDQDKARKRIDTAIEISEAITALFNERDLPQNDRSFVASKLLIEALMGMPEGDRRIILAGHIFTLHANVVLPPMEGDSETKH